MLPDQSNNPLLNREQNKFLYDLRHSWGRVNPTDELDLTQPSKLGRVTNPTDELDLETRSSNSTQPKNEGEIRSTYPNPTVKIRSSIPYPTLETGLGALLSSVDWKLVYRVTITLVSVAAAGWCAMSPLFYLHLPQHLFLQIAANDLPLISMSIAFTVTVTLFNSRSLILCTLATVGSVACALVI